MREVERAPWGRFDSLDSLSTAALQDGRFSVTLDEGRFECFFKRQAGDRLWVLLSAARDPKASRLPKFDRWSWADKFPGSILCISDPTFYLASESLRIGWYVGAASHDWQRRLSDLVRAVAGMLGLRTDQVIAYGSSAGGFASLMLAAHLSDATALAINPQTRVLNYPPAAVNVFLKVAFEGRPAARLNASERLRLDAVRTCGKALELRCLVAQNLDDTTHFEAHFKPFALSLGVPPDGGADRSGRLNALIYRDPRGHAPESPELAVELVSQALALSKASLAPRQPIAPRYQVDWQPQGGSIRALQIVLTPPARARAVQSAPPDGAAGAGPAAPERPLHWTSSPGTNPALSQQQHQWRMLDETLLAFDRAGRTSLLTPVFDVLVSWADLHANFDPAHEAWKGAAVALRAMKIAMLISASPAEAEAPFDIDGRQTLTDLFNAHLQALLDTVGTEVPPPALLDLHAIAALRQVLAGDADQAMIDGSLRSGVRRAVAARFDRHGVSQDNSPGHQLAAVAALRRWLDSGWFAGRGIEALSRRAATVANLFLLPDGRCLPVGDTVATPPPAAPVACAFRASTQLSTRSGHAVYRDDGGGKAARACYLHLMGAHHGGGRKQADDLSVYWYEGEDILIDPGRAAPSAAGLRAYVRSAAAHSTVDIEGSDPSTDPPYGSALLDAVVTDWGLRITARRHDATSGMSHLRHALFAPGRWLLLIDHISGIQPRRLTRWLQFAPALELTLDEQGIARGQLKRGAELTVHSAASGELQAVLVKGQTSPRPQGWVGRGTSGVQPAWALGHGLTACEALFATLLAIDGQASGLHALEHGRLRMQVTAAETGSETVDIAWTDERCDAIWPVLPAGQPGR